MSRLELGALVATLALAVPTIGCDKKEDKKEEPKKDDGKKADGKKTDAKAGEVKADAKADEKGDEGW